MTSSCSNNELKNRLNLNLSCDNIDKNYEYDKKRLKCENRLAKILLYLKSLVADNSKLEHIGGDTTTTSMETLLSNELRGQTQFSSAGLIYHTTTETKIGGGGKYGGISSFGNSHFRVTLQDVFLRWFLPLYNGVSWSWHGIRASTLFRLVGKITASRKSIISFFANTANYISLSLSSVQVSNTINPLFRALKMPTIMLTTNEKADSQEPMGEPEKSVELLVLTEPPPGVPIKADIVFIHGLHGSLFKTWRQGLGNSNGRIMEFERPPKPPVRPPKRPRHSRSTSVFPPHHSKRRRFVYDSDDSSSSSGSDRSESPSAYMDYALPEDSDDDDIEYNFSTFRLRIDDLERQELVTEDSFETEETVRRKHIIDELTSKCWPADWIPLDCPGVRVIALNYTTDPYLWRPIWCTKHNRTNLSERTREMQDLLIEKGVGLNHPIIWVGHSKGGIFIKKILVDVWESGRQAAAALWRSSRGVLFYSVPHRGSTLANIKPPFTDRSVELKEIEKNGSEVLELHRKFVALYRSGNLKIELFSFVETALTFMSFIYIRIIGIDSGDPGIGTVCGVQLDHREICKPRNRSCVLYTKLVSMIRKVTNESTVV